MGHKYHLTEAEKLDFVKCWNEKMPVERMQVRFEKMSVAAVKTYASYLRSKGYDINYQKAENLRIKMVPGEARMTSKNQKPTSKHPWKRNIRPPTEKVVT